MSDNGPQLRYESSIESPNGRVIEVVALAGELDLGVLEVLEHALDGTAADRAGLVIDLSEVGFVDSAGIHALVAARESLADAGTPSALVVAPGSNVERILDMTGLLERLGSQPDRDAALKAVAPSKDG